MPSWKNKRWYDDACATAFALEIVGERWALLIVRELMLGPRRFTELKDDLRGISAKSLSERLERLERAGVLKRHELGRPWNAVFYELSPWGYEAMPIFEAFGRWSLRSPLHDPSLPLSPAAAMLSLRSTLRPTRAPLSIKVAFHFGEERFRVQLEPDGLFIEREAHPFLPSALPRRITGRPALELTLDTRSFRRIFYGKEPLEAALEKGAPDGLTLRGDAALCARFIASFALPPKLSLPVPVRALGAEQSET